jgi:digeranylgeranylglycerophospholipid reductase
MKIECDVLVVGGGPAGSSAARAAALNGAKTIFIDKKKEIGNPVQCAEGIGEYLFPYLPFKIPNEQLIWKMDGMYFQTDDISLERTGDLYKSYSVERKNFDKWLSKLAIEKGAELFSNTQLTDFQFDEEGNVKKATVQKEGKIFDIKPKVLIAADGSESTVLKLLGFYDPKRGDLAEVYSWEMENIELYKSNLEQIFIGSFAPGGYGYVFPKSKKTANVGVGGLFTEKEMHTYFEEFLEIPHLKKQLKHATYMVEKSKKAVIGDLVDEWVYHNVILTGDAANQNLKPFIEGILPSIISADVAGKKAIEMLKGNKLNHQEYFDAIVESMGDNFVISKKMQDVIYDIFSVKDQKNYLKFYGLVTELEDFDFCEKYSHLDYEELKEIVMRKIDEE